MRACAPTDLGRFGSAAGEGGVAALEVGLDALLHVVGRVHDVLGAFLVLHGLLLRSVCARVSLGLHYSLPFCPSCAPSHSPLSCLFLLLLSFSYLFFFPPLFPFSFSF